MVGAPKSWLLKTAQVEVQESGSRLKSQGLLQCFGSGGPRDKLKGAAKVSPKSGTSSSKH